MNEHFPKSSKSKKLILLILSAVVMILMFVVVIPCLDICYLKKALEKSRKLEVRNKFVTENYTRGSESFQITDREIISNVINILNESRYKIQLLPNEPAKHNFIIVEIHDKNKKIKEFDVVSDSLHISKHVYHYQYSDGFQSRLRKALGAREYGMDEENNLTLKTVQ